MENNDYNFALFVMPSQNGTYDVFTTTSMLTLTELKDIVSNIFCGLPLSGTNQAIRLQTNPGTGGGYANVVEIYGSVAEQSKRLKIIADPRNTTDLKLPCTIELY